MRQFWESAKAMESACLAIKAEACPHCGRSGTLNRHGWLRGCEAYGPGKQARRGRRMYCANRGHRKGCGHTFSLRVATTIPWRRTPTAALWTLVRRIFAGTNVAQAWTGLEHVFSLESAYRYRQRLRLGQFRLREALCRSRPPPAAAAGTMSHLHDHLLRVSPCSNDPIAAFQLHYQEAWPG